MITQSWIPVETIPPLSLQDAIGPMSSGPVLVYRKDGCICVARFETWAITSCDFDDLDEAEFHWVTDCSEGWRIDTQVTHWMPLPDIPK